MFKKQKRPLISEPINIITGSLGAGKTLFAIEQADLLIKSGDAIKVFQVGINKPDLRKLPELPFPLEEWHKHAEAGECDGWVIIVDEFHKWMPPRGQGKPAEFVQAMAECRRMGVRFLLLTQSSDFDAFLKGTRLNRHFFLHRKSGMPFTSIYEWAGEFVWDPIKDKLSRERAIRHTWRQPKQYFDWYESAKSHHFRLRIPLRLWLVPAFVVAVAFFGVKAWNTMGGFMGGTVNSAIGKGKEAPAKKDEFFQPSGMTTETVRAETIEAYDLALKPLDPTRPWTAPAFQGQAIATRPELFCVSSQAGQDGNGEHKAGGCHCYTEQGTPADDVTTSQCAKIARHGVYNPFRRSASAADGRGEAQFGPRAADASPTGFSSVGAGATRGDRDSGGVIEAPTTGAASRFRPGNDPLSVNPGFGTGG